MAGHLKIERRREEQAPDTPPVVADDLNVPPMLIGSPLAPQDLLPPPQRYLDRATLLKRVQGRHSSCPSSELL